MTTKPLAGTDLVHGVVQVSVTVPASVDTTWDALTKHSIVSKWFGDLSQDLSTGTTVRLDFGDGDFFEISDIAVEAQTELRYRWRFLGTAPQDQITWKIVCHDSGGCSVVVRDMGRARSLQTIEKLSSVWTDFLERLQRFLSTGDVTRCDWRRDFDGITELSIPVEDAWASLFLGDSQATWIPFGRIPLKSRRLQPTAPSDSNTAYVLDVDWKGYFLVVCQVTKREWAHPTDCRIEFVPRQSGSALIVHHTGWDRIDSDLSYCMRQRREFGQRWANALQRARRFVETLWEVRAS